MSSRKAKHINFRPGPKSLASAAFPGPERVAAVELVAATVQPRSRCRRFPVRNRTDRPTLCNFWPFCSGKEGRIGAVHSQRGRHDASRRRYNTHNWSAANDAFVSVVIFVRVAIRRRAGSCCIIFASYSTNVALLFRFGGLELGKIGVDLNCGVWYGWDFRACWIERVSGFYREYKLHRELFLSKNCLDRTLIFFRIKWRFQIYQKS